MNRLINFLLRLKYSKLPIKVLHNKDTYIDASENGNMEIIENTYKEWASKYSRDASAYEHPPIDWYCGHSHEEINEKLREDTSCLEPHLIDIANNLSVQIINAPRTPHNIIAYRALDMGIIEKIIEEAVEGKTVIDHGFISTSLNYDCLLKEEEFSHYKGFIVASFTSCLDFISRYSSTVICTVTTALLPLSILPIITDFNKFYT